MEQFGQIVCNRHEELWISLKEVCRTWHVEFRVQDRTPDGLTDPRPGRSVINLPVDQLPLFLERLAQVRDSCLKHGQLGAASPGEMVIMDRGERVVLRDPDRMRGHRARQHPRLAVRYSVICQPLATDLAPRPMILKAEFRDLSVGGAQIFLPCRLELGQHVEVAGLIKGLPFRARAEVVGAELQADSDINGGYLRHSLKWLTYNAAAADILTMTLVHAPGESPAHLDAGSEPGASPEQAPEGAAGMRGPTADGTAEASGGIDHSREIGKNLGSVVRSPGAWPPMR